MACISPIDAFYSKDLNPSGKRSLVFDAKKSHSGIVVKIACGQCTPCRTQKAADGALRCYHESRSHEVNTFVTLTYEESKLPSDGGLVHRDFQLFMKRLRDVSEFKIKFVMCGEYGEKNDRPHYHALLFGCDFSDRQFYKRTPRGDRLDTSEKLESLWKLGMCTVGDVSYQSCRYVTGYIHKKIKGDKAFDHYMGRRPEYIVWSNGIGKDFVAEHGAQLYANDFAVMEGAKMKLPRYYDLSYEIVDSPRLAVVKRARVARARVRASELRAREDASGHFNTYHARETFAKSAIRKRDDV